MEEFKGDIVQGKVRMFLGRRWDLSRALRNMLDLQKCSLMATGRRNDSVNKAQE